MHVATDGKQDAEEAQTYVLLQSNLSLSLTASEDVS